MKIVIIGGVAGGATAAARLRRLNEACEIIIFEKDEYIAFANCGLPYYIGGVITDRSKLLLQSVEGMKMRYGIDVRNCSEVTCIDVEKKEVAVLNHKTGAVYRETFDKLIYAPGAQPIVPAFPSLKETANCFSLRNIPDTDRIHNYIEANQPQTAVVVGGGFIGVEMAENLSDKGISVTLIDRLPQILSVFDEEMVSILEMEMKRKGIRLVLHASVSDINTQEVQLSDGTKIPSDLTLLALGVQPLSKLAKEAGIRTNERGAVVVNSKLETSAQDIYAVGDVVATTHYITGKEVHIPLAGPANRQARLVADIISGIDVHYTGVLGTSILKVFGLTAASTGLNEVQLKANGLNYDSIIVHRGSHAGYYPGAATIALKLLFEKTSGQIWGAQAVGAKGVDKRIDVIATAIKGQLKISDLEDLELCYAPPYSSAKDPVNILGYAATNVHTAFSSTFKYNEMNKATYLIDVRTSAEFNFGNISTSINIPVDELRTKLHQLPEDKDTPLFVYCQVGLRGYLAQRILLQAGYTQVFNLSGGYSTYSAYHKNKEITETTTMNATPKLSPQQTWSENTLDARGLQCPGPIVELYKTMQTQQAGATLRVLVTDCGFSQDVGAWCDKHGHHLQSVNTKEDGSFEAIIIKAHANHISTSSATKMEDKGSIVLFSGDLDKALGAMIIAQGAQAMGKQMTVFFTFWGINLLRKSESVNVDKTAFEKMFGMIMPKGAKKAQLSQMGMFGIGTEMIKSRMKDKNVDSLPVMIQKALDAGVKMIVCTMSMDLMGIKEEELIDGLEYAGVAKYIADSTGADLTLFI